MAQGPVKSLMGGSPEQLPERYAIADPLAHVPLGIPVLLVHGIADETVSVELSRTYESAERSAGGVVELVEIEGEAGSASRPHRPPRSGMGGGHQSPGVRRSARRLLRSAAAVAIWDSRLHPKVKAGRDEPGPLA